MAGSLIVNVIRLAGGFNLRSIYSGIVGPIPRTVASAFGREDRCFSGVVIFIPAVAAIVL